MNCEEFKIQMVERLDASSLLDETGWQEHRRHCESCRREAIDFEAFQGLIRQLPPQEAPPSHFWERQTRSILDRIDSTPPRASFRFWEGLLKARSVFATAALILLMILGVRLMRQEGRPLSGDSVPMAEQFFDPDSSEREDLAEGGALEEMNADQMDSYYASLAEKLLSSEEWDEDDDPWIDLSPEELDRLVDHFEKASSRRTL